MLIKRPDYHLAVFDFLLNTHNLLFKLDYLRHTLLVQVPKILILSKPLKLPPKSLCIAQIELFVALFPQIINFFIELQVTLFLRFKSCFTKIIILLNLFDQSLPVFIDSLLDISFDFFDIRKSGPLV